MPSGLESSSVRGVEPSSYVLSPLKLAPEWADNGLGRCREHHRYSRLVRGDKPEFATRRVTEPIASRHADLGGDRLGNAAKQTPLVRPARDLRGRNVVKANGWNLVVDHTNARLVGPSTR